MRTLYFVVVCGGLECVVVVVVPQRHLSREEFEALFKMTRAEFYRLPAWKQNDEKMRLGLWTSDEKARASVSGVV